MKLPDSVQEIADVIGREQALLLISRLPRCYAGSKAGKKSWSDVGTTDKRSHRVVMYVPTVPRLNANHQLVQILGWHDAIKLCKAFGGEIMHPANCAGYYRSQRDEEAVRLVEGGMKKADVAAQLGISERHVRNIVRAAAENPPEVRQAAANDNAPVDNKARA